MNKLFKIVLLFMIFNQPVYSITFNEMDKIYHKILYKNKIFHNIPKLYLNPSNLISGGYNPAGNYIIITKGMLDNLTRDELAFTLCHELGHFILRTGKTPKTEDDADMFGVDLLSKSGYNKCEGVKILNIFKADKEHNAGYLRYNKVRCK